MPKFNPLRFSIEIVDNIDSQLKGIQSKIENAFKSVPIGFTLDQGSVEQLRRQLQSVTQGLDLSKLQMPDMSKVIEQSVNAAVSKLNNIKDSNVNVNISDGSIKLIDAIIEKLNSIKEIGITLKINNLADINRMLSEISAPVINLTMPNQRQMENQLREYAERLTALQGAMNKPADSNIGKQAWNDVDALKALVEQADKATASIKALSDKNSVQNSGKSSTLFKQFTDLGKGLTDAIGQTPKVEESSLNAFINIIKQKFDEIQAEVDRRGKGLSSTFSAQFNTIRQNLSNLTAMGINNGDVVRMQQEMAGIASAFNGHIQSMQAQLGALKEAISNDNFSALTSRIEKCAEGMDKLTAAFEKFNGVVGNNKSMADFMTGLGEVVRNVRFKLQQLGEGMGNMSIDQASNNYTRNVTIMVEALNQLQDAQLRVTTAMDKAKQSGAPTTEYERYLKLLRSYMTEVRAQKDDVGAMGVSGAASLFLGKSVKHFNDNSRALEKMAEDYQKASLKISAATVDIDSSLSRLNNLMVRTSKTGLPITDLKNAAQALEDWKKKMASTNDVMGKAGFAGQAQQDIENAKVLIRLQEERNKNNGIYYTLLAEAKRRLAGAEQTRATASGLGLDTTAIDNIINKVKEVRNRMANEGLKNLDSTQLIRELGTSYRRLAYEMRNVVKEQERLNNKQKSTNESEAKKWAESARQAAVEQDALNRKLKEYQNLITRASELGLDTTNLQNSVAVIQDKISKLEKLKSGAGLVFKGGILTTSDYIKTPDYISAARDANTYAQALNGAVNAMKSGKTEEQLWAESKKDAATKLSTLIPLMERMKALSSVGQQLKIDTKDLDNAIAKIQDWMNKLKKLSEGDKTMGYTKDILRNPAFATDMAGLQNAANPIRQEISSIREMERAKRAAGKAAKEMTIEEQKLAQVMEQVTQSAKGQSQVLNDLKSMAAQYFSVYAAQQFLGKIIEVGGQLENQRLSIAAILGDVSHANTLFEQIQSLAVKSPFGVVELDQYTKQLSAFGFKYNELYDMTKRLADISAGAGTDVGRLALALGHVRSEGALTGYTLRQFAMNNIPMLKELSTMLSAREGRIVSTADIRKRVSKKMIGFEDVQQVIKNLTNEGGMFYNMQEVISGSTKSKWKNLRDALDIMYGRMAESSAIGGTLKDTAAWLTNLTKHWQELIAVMGAGVATWGISRMAVNLYNVSLGKNATAVFKAMTTARKQEILNQEIAASYRKVSAAEQANVATKNAQIVTTAKLALNTGKLSAEELSRSVALGVMTKKEAFMAIAQSNLTITTKRQMAAMIRNTQVLGAAGRAVVSLSIGLNKLWASMAAIVTNPMTWIMAAVTAITELWAKNKSEMERLREAAKDIYTKGDEGLKNTAEFIAANGIEVVDENGNPITDLKQSSVMKNASFKFPAYAELDEQSVKSIMENAEQYIREYSATPNQMLNDAFALNKETKDIPTLQQQYESLAKSVEEVAKAQALLKGEIADVVEYSLGATDSKVFWGWFDEDLVTNINDYSNALKDYNNALSEFYEENKARKQVPLQNALTDELFAKDVQAINATREANKQALLSEAEMIKMLVENSTKYQKALSLYSLKSENGSAYHVKFYSKRNSAFKEMEKDLDTFVEKTKVKLEATGWDFTNLTKAQKGALNLMISQVVAKAGDATDAVKQEIIKLTSEKFGIQLDVEEEEAIGKISAMKLKLEELIGKRYVVEVGITGSLDDDLSKVDSAYKKAQEQIKRYGKYLVDEGLIGKEGEFYSEDGMNPNLTEEERKDIQERERQKQAERDKFVLSKRNGEIIQNKPMGTDQTISEYAQAVLMKDALDKWYKEHGLTPPDDNKNGRGSGSYKDEFAKRWDERIRIMKEAYDWYDKWMKEYGKETALDKVNSRYADVFESWRTDPNEKLRFDFDVNSIESYAKYVRQIKEDAFARYNQQKNSEEYNNGQEALRVYRQAVSLLTDMDWDKMRKESEMYASDMTRAIQLLTDKWKTFDEIRKNTGDVTTAAIMSGLSAGDASLKNIADAAMMYIKNAMQGVGLGDALNFGELFNMSDKAIDETIQGLFVTKSDDEKKAIDGIVEALKKWRDLQKEIFNTAIASYNKLMTSGQSYADKVNKIKTEYDNAIKANEGLSAPQRQAADAKARANYQAALFDIAPETVRFFNNFKNMSFKEADATARKPRKELEAMFANGTISAKDYADKIKQIDNNMRTFGTERGKRSLYGRMGYAGGTFFGKRDAGNIQDLQSERADIAYRLDAERAKGAEADSNLIAVLERLAQAIDNILSGTGGRSEVKAAATYGNAVQSWGSLGQAGQKRMGGQASNERQAGVGTTKTTASKITDNATKALDKFAKGLDVATQSVDFFSTFAENVFGSSEGLIGLKDVLGGTQQGMQAGQGITDALAGFGVNLGPWGAAAGAAMGMVSGIFAARDNKLQRQIEELKTEVTKIQNNTSLLKDIRERTLGYDYGDTGRSYARMYWNRMTEAQGKQQQYGKILSSFYGYTKEASVSKQMYEYYTRGGAGTSYQQEYNNLLKERNNLEEQLDKQLSKKKKSQADIEETKKQIAELNDQIYNFTQDLAKELWDIDIKSWAQQLSDALCNAFDNGENAAKAYNETVQDIIRQMLNKMMTMAVIEPMFKKLQDQLFGELQADGTYKGGVIDLNNPQQSAQKVADIIGQYFGTDGEGRKTITAAQEYLVASEKALNDVGFTRKNSDTTTLGNGIQGTSEETSNLLAGYVNALRQDVAIKRMMLEQFMGEYWESYIGQITAMQTSLNNIDRNVAAIYALMNEQGAMYGLIDSIDSRIRRLANGQDKITVA